MDPRLRFLFTGIYYDSPMGASKVSTFARNLAFALIAELERAGKRFEIFADPRPEHEQKALLPDVAKAIYERRIQCLIAPRLNFTNRDALLRVGVPAVFLGAVKLPLKAGRTKNIPSVDTSFAQFFAEGMKRSAERGCRSIGIICNIWRTGHPRDIFASFYDEFRREARRAGLATRAEWIREPVRQLTNLEQHGYDDFRRLWKLGQKPDALMAYPDGVALGVIQAVLETGAHRSANPMQFVFHQNARQKYFCSFPATFGVLDEDRLAEEMILQLQRQFDGEKPGMKTIPYRFVSG